MSQAAAERPGVSIPSIKFLGRDLTASIVVFLVAMPLCMGIAVASGVAPEKGLITGIIGGIVVGALAGSPLQVSGPAAGLAVIVFELVRDQGLSALGPILILAGAIQVVAGIFRLGGWFRAISPAVVHGMLAGIGVLIVVGQFHVLFDERPLSSGPENLAAMPGRLLGLSSDIQATEIAFIASAETLLSAAAVDKMHDGVRTDYNKELRAQGVGNLLCGFAGSLPMTGVIVRSSANVQAGAVTRSSAILHGIWILGFVALLPWLLRAIPMASLGAVLVVTGWRLVSLKHARHLFKDYGVLPVAIWAVTLFMVVATDLLTGVLTGIALTMLELIPNLRRLKLKVREERDGDAHSIELDGAATFVTLPKLSATLDRVPSNAPVRLDVSKLDAVDHTSAELLRDWFQRRKAAGNPVELRGQRGRIATLGA